jgi:gluconate 2-dehydrogenase gamma chain
MLLQAAAAAGAGWATADLSQIQDALAWAAQQAGQSGRDRFAVFSAAEAAVVEALTSRILPADGQRPGAREAGVVHFIDRALSTFGVSERKVYRDGVADLNLRTRRRWKDVTSFAALSASDQDELLRDIEQTPFFNAARFATIVGTFALPTWGGNRDYAGWRLIGFERRPAFQPPFGAYDAGANGRK